MLITNIVLLRRNNTKSKLRNSNESLLGLELAAGAVVTFVTFAILDWTRLNLYSWRYSVMSYVCVYLSLFSFLSFQLPPLQKRKRQILQVALTMALVFFALGV